VHIERTGDWEMARRLLEGSPAKISRALTLAVRQEAELLRKQILEGITRQAPGGAPFDPPLAPTTLAARKLKGFSGTKTLLRRGDLRNSITVEMQGDRAFVGVNRKARAKNGSSLADIARVHEEGAGPFVVPMTPKMRRFLFALFRRLGSARRGGHGAGGRGADVVVIQIPARPFLRPAFEAFRKGASARFLARVARLAGLTGPGGVL